MGFFICTPSAHLYSYLHKIHVCFRWIMAYSNSLVPKYLHHGRQLSTTKSFLEISYHESSDLTIAGHVQKSKALEKCKVPKKKQPP
uniref:Uncharacterized protein n=1 Tax=Arundo donax TaxID=35708 RepID=A0A0A9FJ45_ARUDO